MLLQILAGVVKVGGANGVEVSNYPKMEIGGNLMIIIIILAMIVLRYLVSRMRHKQIMAAIEKGLPIPERKSLTWKGFSAPTNIALAPAMFVVAAGFIYMVCQNRRDTGAFLGICVFCGLSIFFLIRGLFQLKANKAKANEQLSSEPEQ